MDIWEIAELLNLNQSTIRTRLSRGRDRLKGKLGARGDNND
ncbi:hypothetical protein H9655_14710 [Cytobacillus sp. Sa5YUA1]|uniref:RNA polymerase sigma factor 70 region 4 type 2 domain-containing protein n=1 Tax=Cytobacillus stercorigallinarum TaxID=2762240 RepID=A0ABR8QRW5_9BACI|nr:hypothetical protein [Cytobacillus stercorigallinarum]